MAATHTHEMFSSRIGFIFAAIGAAVGLGNIWKFPYMLGVNGGAAFVLVYLVAILLIATPIMLGEMILGRRGRMSAVNSLRSIAIEIGSTPKWSWLGWVGMCALFMILSFFSVIAGWALAYIFKTASGTFTGMSPDEVGATFGQFLHNPGALVGWHAAFMICTVFIVARGIKGGIERAVTIMMPTLFVMLIGLVIYGMFAGEFLQAVDYLFTPDFSKITPQVTLAAVGQAFFSVNVGIGGVLTYAAYLPDDADLVSSSFIVVLGDTLVALLAGLMIFPIVFAYNLDPAQGPGLIFVTLSTAFANMPGGSLIGAAFFSLIFLAALTSSISMLETSVSRLEEIKGSSRAKMAMALGSGIFLFGLLTVFSFNYIEDFHPLGFIKMFENKTAFDLLDFLTLNIIMPLGGLTYAIFVGWWLTKEMKMETLGLKDELLFKVWHFLIRYVVPIAVIAIFIFNLVN
jgi:neurotransmitter:Na+ symporter, NSS family